MKSAEKYNTKKKENSVERRNRRRWKYDMPISVVITVAIQRRNQSQQYYRTVYMRVNQTEPPSYSGRLRTIVKKLLKIYAQ